MKISKKGSSLHKFNKNSGIDSYLVRAPYSQSTVCIHIVHFSVAGTSSAAALFSAFLAASFSFSSLISLNLLMFSVKSGPLCKVMKSFAFLLSPLDPATVIVLVLISLKVAYLFLYKRMES